MNAFRRLDDGRQLLAALANHGFVLLLARLDVTAWKADTPAGGHRPAPPDRQIELTAAGHGHDAPFHRPSRRKVLLHLAPSTASGGLGTPAEPPHVAAPIQ